MYTYTYSVDNLEDLIESIKVATLQALVVENLIKENVADEWCENHTLIFKKKGIFKTISDKWFKEIPMKNGDGEYLIAVKKV